MAFKNLLDKLKDAKDVMSEPTEYDDLDTSGYSPTQQMGAQGLTKTLRAVGAVTPDPIEIETPDGQKILFDPTIMGGLKTVGNLAKLAKMKAPLQSNEAIQGLASQYSKAKGLTNERMPAVQVDETRAKLLADAFENMKHDPTNPEVKKAYDALIRETKDQYQTIKKTGFNPIKITPEM